MREFYLLYMYQIICPLIPQSCLFLAVMAVMAKSGPPTDEASLPHLTSEPSPSISLLTAVCKQDSSSTEWIWETMRGLLTMTIYIWWWGWCCVLTCKLYCGYDASRLSLSEDLCCVLTCKQYCGYDASRLIWALCLWVSSIRYGGAAFSELGEAVSIDWHWLELVMIAFQRLSCGWHLQIAMVSLQWPYICWWS